MSILLNDEEVARVLCDVDFGAYDDGKLLSDITYLQVCDWLDSASKITAKKVVEFLSPYVYHKQDYVAMGMPSHIWQSLLKEIEEPQSFYMRYKETNEDKG